jgi:hypothetical protein
MKKLFILALAMLATATCKAYQHPCLLFTSSEVSEMNAGKASAPIFAQSLDEIIAAAEQSLKSEISVPVPCDGGGGPVHEQHKANYYEMFRDGIAYRFTGDMRFARRVAAMLDKYADMYPTLGYHPVELSPVRGRLFWQTLNESVWLVNTSMAYDCVRDALTDKQREKIESRLLVPMADFIMKGNEANINTFNKMHNHATWATAAVGMMGLATDRDDYVNYALYGQDLTGQHGGFLQQIDWLFSPDGYYTEGAYYERYALSPFVIFAQCLQHTRPELDIFNRRGAILEKALDVLYQMSYDGEFFHINDSLEKGLSAQEIVYAADILYGANPNNESLPYIVKNYQRRVVPCYGGYKVAQAVAAGAGENPTFRSVILRDGKDGDEGALGIIRTSNNMAVVLKATSHGLSHGHYDKLSMQLFDNDREIFIDYGAARFVNLEAKYKGHYTHENDSFCKQSISHNTVTADCTSHFGGKYKLSSAHHADIVDSGSGEKMSLQYMTGLDTCAYAKQGIKMQRTLCTVELPDLDYPVVLDIFDLRASADHQYDLPYWFRGHLVSTNYERTAALSEMHTLGSSNGYQHIWVEAEGATPTDKAAKMTFFNGNRMYSITTASTTPLQAVMLRAGANDPDFNLRHEQAYMLRAAKAKDCVIANVIEPHGQYDVVAETAAGTVSSIDDVTVSDNAGKIVVTISYKGHRATFDLDKKQLTYKK